MIDRVSTPTAHKIVLMERSSIKIVEIRADGDEVRGGAYEVRTGPIVRAIAWAALALGAIVGLLILIPLALFGALLGFAVLVLWLSCRAIAAVGASAGRRVGGSGRRNVRVVRGQ